MLSGVLLDIHPQRALEIPSETFTIRFDSRLEHGLTSLLGKFFHFANRNVINCRFCFPRLFTVY